MAAAAICAGWVWSYSTYSLSGWPLTPPFAFTHAKYALIMFGPSLKSVPGCLVSIVPMLIGVPVAATPGFLPHADVLVLPPLEPELAAVVALVLDALLGAAPELVLLLLLLPQPASTNAPTSAASAKLARRRSAW